MIDEQEIDWSECALAEVKPNVQSGVPVLAGTRLPLSAIVDNYEYGESVEDISENFTVDPELVRAILLYARDHKIAHSVR